MSFTPVTDITNFAPLQVHAGVEYELSALVEPPDATNQTIEWSLVSGNASIRKDGVRHYLTPHVAENIALRATIRNGIQQ